MPRRKLELPKTGKQGAVNCFAYRTLRGKPDCTALQDIYCMKEDKPCPFRATPEEAAAARRKAMLRLIKTARG